MSEDQQNQEPCRYIAYMGKRLNKDNVLIHTYIDVDEKGIPTGEGGYAEYYQAKKFQYAKRPHVGVIYRIRYTDSSKKSFWNESDEQRYHSRHKYDAKWQAEHKAAVSLSEQNKRIKSEMSADVLGEMTLEDLRLLIAKKPYAERTTLMALVLQYMMN